MTTAIAHECTGIDCMTCIDAEREAAGRRIDAAPKKFRKYARKVDAVTEAYNVGFKNGKDDRAANPQPFVAPKQSVEVALDAVTGADMKGNFASAQAALAFILAGNAYFTIRSMKTGTRYTFRVNKADCMRCGQSNCKCWSSPSYFVALLAGPDNNSDYQYMGMIRDNVFRLTAKSRVKEDSTVTRAFRWVFERLQRSEIPPQTEIWHEGRCGRCGRKLTVPESVAAGIGPDCAERL